MLLVGCPNACSPAAFALDQGVLYLIMYRHACTHTQSFALWTVWQPPASMTRYTLGNMTETLVRLSTSFATLPMACELKGKPRAVGWAVAARSDPGSPPGMYLARLPASGGGGSAPWQWWRAAAEHVAPHAPEVEAALAGITYEVLQVGFHVRITTCLISDYGSGLRVIQTAFWTTVKVSKGERICRVVSSSATAG